MHNDLMLFSYFWFYIVLSLSTIEHVFCQQTTIYVQLGGTAELCENLTSSIYAYEYRSFDGKKNSIIEPWKHEHYSNPYQTTVLRITNVTDNDSGQYKCPQDDTAWQNLQVYVPVQHVRMNNLHKSSDIRNQDPCGNENLNCISMIEGEPLDIVCAADGSPRPAIDISFDKNGTAPTIMALANGIQSSSILNDQFKPSVYEAYRILGLKPSDNGRNITCQVDMKQIDKRLTLSVTKQLHMEFRPYVLEKSKKIYVGINQTRTINCSVQYANPSYIRYSINGLSPSIIHRTYGEQHNLQYTFDIMPTSIEHFRPFNITANNSIGYDTCTYELIHGGVPDAIQYCVTDAHTSNITITISCNKSYAQGDNDGYACTLFKYNEKSKTKMFEEIARTKSCIFALENFHEPVEFRVAAFNRYGALPVNLYGHRILLNQSPISKETPFLSRKMVIVAACIVGSIILLFFFCQLCSACGNSRPNKNDSDRTEKKIPPESEALKSDNDEGVSPLMVETGDKQQIQNNGAVYDTPSHLIDGKNLQHTDGNPSSNVYYQQGPQRFNNLHYIDRDSASSSLRSIPPRTRTVHNKVYGHPVVDNNYGLVSPTTMVVPTSTRRFVNNNEREDDSPYSTTEFPSEAESFCVPKSAKRSDAPPTKPRYSTSGSIRVPVDNLDKTPLPKPRSRSNSRTRLNNPNADTMSNLYEDRPVSSSDSGIDPLDTSYPINIDPLRSGFVKSRQNSLQRHNITPVSSRQQTSYQTATSLDVHATEC